MCTGNNQGLYNTNVKSKHVYMVNISELFDLISKDRPIAIKDHPQIISFRSYLIWIYKLYAFYIFNGICGDV